MKINTKLPSAIEKVEGVDWGIDLYVKREDEIHHIVSGNKYRKLKYQLENYYTKDYKGIVSFGGVYSNHLHALAYVCKIEDIPCTGIIRGEDDENNPTLSFLKSCGMQLYFVSRSAYRLKQESDEVKSILDRFDQFLMVPEGGGSELALPGVIELVDEITATDHVFDFIAVSAGTGYTALGMLKGLQKHQLKSHLLVFSALQGKFLDALLTSENSPTSFTLTDEYCFGGYAKTNETLLAFKADTEQKTNIPIDYVYNGKLLFGLKDMAMKGRLPKKSKVLWIHTGGLQGNIL